VSDPDDRAAPSAARDLAAAIALLLAIAAVALPLPYGVPSLIPLVAIASLSLWLDGTSWADAGLRARIDGALEIAVGSAVGIAALAAGVWLFAPAFGGATGVGFNAAPEVRGNGAFLFSALILAWASAFAAEMIFRGWLLRLIEQSARRHAVAATPAIAWGVIGSAIFQVAVLAPDGPLDALGAFLAAVGYAALYLGSRRGLVAGIACRGAFDTANLLLIYLRII
jgi:membrane protease YdiL (CAAX protease family)